MQGRKIPPDTWKKFPHVLAQVGGSITAAANQLGIDPRSVYYQMRRSPAFAEKIQVIYDTTVVPILEQQMYSLALSKDYRAMRFILANRAPRRWNTEFVLRAELEAELARELKKIKENKPETYARKYLSMSDYVVKEAYEQAYLDNYGEDVPDQLVIDMRSAKAAYASVAKQREAWLKNNPDQRRHYGLE